MASRGINASWLQYASSRNVSWWVSPTPRIWNATRWCPCSRLSSILTTTSWISLINARPYATTYAWPYATADARSHASSYARTYATADARLHATSYARNGRWLCSSSYDGSASTNGSTRLLPLTGSSYGNFSSRRLRKTYASQNN